MGTIAPVASDAPKINKGRSILWETLSQANASGDGAVVGFADTSVSVHVFGTWNGATATIHGSNDGVTYTALKKPDGTAAALTADGFVSLADLPLYIKPVLTGAGASTDLDAVALVR